ncbi:hypothetical protein K501DRAFT_227949, partial [Backusella circina FSU 941]
MPFKRTASATPPPITNKRKNVSSDKEDFDTSDYDDTLEQEEHSKKKRFRKQQEEQQEQNLRAAEDSDHDASGEIKIDKHGNLKGDRQYRVPTFALPKRGGMLFMFSKDPAALLGFRDSFVFLKKNKKLQKVHISNEEKGYLVDENLLRSTFRTREISVVTARSVFKQFGHRIVKKGKKGRDDYYFTEEEYEESEEEEEVEHHQHHHEELSIATTTTAPITTVTKS